MFLKLVSSLVQSSVRLSLSFLLFNMIIVYLLIKRLPCAFTSSFFSTSTRTLCTSTSTFTLLPVRRLLLRPSYSAPPNPSHIYSLICVECLNSTKVRIFFWVLFNLMLFLRGTIIRFKMRIIQ